MVSVKPANNDLMLSKHHHIIWLLLRPLFTYLLSPTMLQHGPKKLVHAPYILIDPSHCLSRPLEELGWLICIVSESLLRTPFSGNLCIYPIPCRRRRPVQPQKPTVSFFHTHCRRNLSVGSVSIIEVAVIVTPSCLPMSPSKSAAGANGTAFVRHFVDSTSQQTR
jgi:hypothetical protein